MKTLLPLMILATIVSCGEKSESKSKKAAGRAIEMITAGTYQGMVTETLGTGKDNSYDYPSKSFKVVELNKQSREIVLKKEGSLVYRYEEDRDSFGGVQKSVSLEDLSESGGLVSALRSGAARLEGNNMIFNTMGDFGSSSNEYEINSKVNLSGVMDLSKPCSSTMDEKDIEVVGIANGKTETLPNLVRKEVKTCGEALTKEELKKLDLTSVTFCDYRGDKEEIHCEMKDMSYLTSDL